jgi:hypothetical protein
VTCTLDINNAEVGARFNMQSTRNCQRYLGP